MLTEENRKKKLEMIYEEEKMERERKAKLNLDVYVEQEIREEMEVEVVEVKTKEKKIPSNPLWQSILQIDKIHPPSVPAPALAQVSVKE